MNFSKEPSRQEAETASAICVLIEENLGIDNVTADEDFFNLGGTSLQGAILLVQIERQLGTRLSLADLYENPTAAGLAARLKQDRSGITGSFSAVWLPSPHFGASKSPVFLVHFIPADLSRAISLRRPVIGLSYGLAAGGDDTGWPPPVGVEALAAHYVAEMRRVHPSGPYHLVGHSRGGVIAWEMARQLRESGYDVGALCLVDTRPPPWAWVVYPNPRVGWRTLLRKVVTTPPRLLAIKTIRFARNRLLTVVDRFSEVLQTPQERWNRRWNRLNQPSRLGMIDLRLGVYRMRALSGQPLLIEATKLHPMQMRSEMAPLASAYDLVGLTPDGQVLVQIPGDHLSIVSHPLAEQVAAAIEDAIQSHER